MTFEAGCDLKHFSAIVKISAGQAGFNNAEGMLDQSFYADVTMGINF